MAETDTSTQAFVAYMHDVRSAGTADKYGLLAKQFLRALKDFDCTSLESLPQHTLIKYTSHLARGGYSPQSIQLALAAAKRYLRWVSEQGVAVPAQHQPDLPRINYKIGETLPAEMLNRYMEVASEILPEPYRTCVMLMPCLGMRGNELSTLPISAISKAHVRMRSAPAKETIIVRVTGKGGKERIVPLLDIGKPILMNYLTHWRKKVGGPFLFPKLPKGRLSISNRSLRDYLAKLREPLNMDDMTPHTLRRTYATNLFRSGVAAEVVAKVLGHASVVTTMKHYLNLDEEDILAAVHKGARREH